MSVDVFLSFLLALLSPPLAGQPSAGRVPVHEPGPAQVVCLWGGQALDKS